MDFKFLFEIKIKINKQKYNIIHHVLYSQNRFVSEAVNMNVRTLISFYIRNIDGGGVRREVVEIESVERMIA